MPRRPHDAYMTPPWQTHALLKHQPLGDDAVVLEPCSGDQSIAREVFHATGAVIVTNDIDPAMPAMYHDDASTDGFWNRVTHGKPPIDWVITNPPFAMPTNLQILEHALATARIGVAMIQRLSFLEPTAADNPARKQYPRGPFLAEHPPDRMIVLPRYSYTGNGKSDSVTTAWMIWFTDVAWVGWAQEQDPIICAYRAKEG